MILLTRKAEFSSAHYYWNDAWSPEENQRVFGKCANLNLEVPEFAARVPTTENIAISIWQRLDGKIPLARLHRVRVYELPDLFADYYGEP